MTTSSCGEASFSNPIPARGVRVHWEDLPPEIRAAFEERLGGRVIEAITQPTGFSPGLAARLRVEDGRRFFLKAVHETANPDTPGIHRREARVVAAMPRNAPVPTLLWSCDEEGWVALCFEDIDARHPHEPWTEHDLALVVRTLNEMAVVLTPSPFPTEETVGEWFEHTINGWQLALGRGEDRLDAWCTKNLSALAELEAEAPLLVEGDSLLHCDVRADNLLIAQEPVYVVDWPWARLGPSWGGLGWHGAERRHAGRTATQRLHGQVRPEPGLGPSPRRGGLHHLGLFRGPRTRAAPAGYSHSARVPGRSGTRRRCVVARADRLGLRSSEDSAGCVIGGM